MNQIIKLFFLIFIFNYFYAEEYRQAALLPLTQRKRPHLGPVDYFLLARDKNTGLWSFFVADKNDDETNPTQTAARAFEQSSPCSIIPCLSLQNYINISQAHTAYVIENSDEQIITFITRFGARKIKSFKECFFEKGLASTIDALALVRWENIEQMIYRGKDSTCAFILNPKRDEYRTIQISQDFIKAVKPFFLRKSFAVGYDKRVRIYNTHIYTQ